MIRAFYIDLEAGESGETIPLYRTPAFVDNYILDLMKGHEDSLAQSLKMLINTTPQARSGDALKSMVIHHSGPKASGIAAAMSTALKARKFGVDYAIDTDGNILKYTQRSRPRLKFKIPDDK